MPIQETREVMGKERMRREERREKTEGRREKTAEGRDNREHKKREIRLDEMKAKDPGPGSK